jgi:Protein of unknown function (DUF2637)
MTGADRVIRWTTAGVVVGVAAVAAVASYEHAYALVRAHGEVGWTARLVPLTVDGLIYASSMVIARLGASQGAGSGAGAVAARRRHRGDPGGEHRPRPGSWSCRRGCGRVACGRAGRLLRTPDDDHPQRPRPSELGERSPTARCAIGPRSCAGARSAGVRRRTRGVPAPFGSCDPRAAPCGAAKGAAGARAPGWLPSPAGNAGHPGGRLLVWCSGSGVRRSGRRRRG